MWVLIPIAITAVAGAVGAWQLQKTTTTVAEKAPFALTGIVLVIVIAAVILLILMLRKPA